jgi:hypothetical protein
VVADLQGPKIRYRDRLVDPLEMIAAVYQEVASANGYSGIMTDMTPARLASWSHGSGIPFGRFLDEKKMLGQLRAVAIAMRMSGVKWLENGLGVGPRIAGSGAGFKIESFTAAGGRAGE